MVALAPLVVLAGPTASGKSSLGIALAERFHGEIISCDSVAVYRGMDIGSAKPTAAERARIPHHCLDLYTPDEPTTAGDYARHARAAIADITARGKLPIVAGGTGLYLRATLEGLAPSPPRDESLRERLRTAAAKALVREEALLGREAPSERGALSAQEALLEQEALLGRGFSPAVEKPKKQGASAPEGNSTYLHRLLQRLDPTAAANIHPNDTPKLIRAIEVTLTARRPQTEQWQAGRDPLTGYRTLKLGLAPERGALYDRINSRCARMFTDGILEETAAIRAQYGDNCRALTSLGYAQALAVLRNELSLPEAVAQAQQGHRNYAKRQLTWFRADKEMHWLPGFGNTPTIEAEAVASVVDFLRT